MGYGNTESFTSRNLPDKALPDGLYLLKGLVPEADPPGVFIPVVKLGETFYSVKLDEALTVEGFSPGSRLLGPLQ